MTQCILCKLVRGENNSVVSPSCLNLCETHQNKSSSKARSHNTRHQEKNLGRLGKLDWANVLAEFKHRCVICGIFHEQLTLDHIVQLCRYGRNELGNIQPLCYEMPSYQG